MSASSTDPIFGRKSAVLARERCNDPVRVRGGGGLLYASTSAGQHVRCLFVTPSSPGDGAATPGDTAGQDAAPSQEPRSGPSCPCAGLPSHYMCERAGRPKAKHARSQTPLCRPSLRRKSARRGAGSVEPGTQVLEGSPAPQKERSCTTLPSGRTFCGACACRRSHRTLPAFSREVIQRRRHTVAEQAVTGRTEVVTRSARAIHDVVRDPASV